MSANNIGNGVARVVWNYASGGQYVYVSPNRLAYSEESRSGVRRRRPTGFKPPTSYSLQSLFIAEPVGVWSYVFPPGNYYTSIMRSGVVPQFSPDYYGPTTVPSQLSSMALTRAMLSAKDMKVDVATSLAEGIQTADLLSSTATFLADSYSAIRSRDWKKLKRITGWSSKPGQAASTAADAWLSYRYGWTPLISTVYGAAEALAETARTIKPSTAFGFAEESVNRADHVGSGTEYARMYETTGIVGSKVRLDFQVDGGCLSQLRSLGLTNPLLVAWELVPYSFVVDWFIPIGNALSAADWATGLTFIGGSQSNLVRAKTMVRPGQLAENVTADVSGMHRRVYLSRVPFTSSPSVPLPSFSLPFPSSNKVLDSMALLFNAFSSPSFK